MLLVVMTAMVLTVFAISAGAASASEPSLNIAGANLSFSESVYIKYAVERENVNDGDVRMLIWTAPQAEYVYGTQADIIEPKIDTIDGVEYLVFNYTKLAAKQMTDTVYARACVEINGEYVYSNVKKYSILKYAYNKLGKTGTATDDGELITLLEDMLEYGKLAQIHFNYKMDRLATDDYYQVKVVNGSLSDGSDWELGKTGDTVTMTAADRQACYFTSWTDAKGNVVSTDKTFTVAIGTANATYTANYDHYHQYEQNVIAPTANTQGYTENVCWICGDSYISDYVDALVSLEYTLTDGGDAYYVSGIGNAGADVTVPTTYNGKPVVAIGEGAFAGAELTSISFGRNITAIGSNAFDGIDGLTINYNSTKRQWIAVDKASGWNTGLVNYRVYVTGTEDDDWGIVVTPAN